MGKKALQRGVTLPELLVALFIFAMISGAGVYALRLAVDGREQLERADSELREWQIARMIIRQDLAQLAERTVRDEFGQPQAGPFIGGIGFAGRLPVENETPLAGFVRRGWVNPGNAAPRSSLQYVEYVLKGDDIVRRTRPYLDDARGQPETDRVLFSGVSNVEFSFLAGETSEGLQWADAWPGPGARGFAPRAVRLVFATDRLGEVEQLFWIGDLSETARETPS